MGIQAVKTETQKANGKRSSKQTEKRCLAMMKDHNLKLRALAAYLADFAKVGQSISDQEMLDLESDVVGSFEAELPELWEKRKGRVPTPIYPDLVHGEIDHSKRMPIITLYRMMGVPSWLENEGTISGGQIIAKYRYAPKTDKLSRIG